MPSSAGKKLLLLSWDDFGGHGEGAQAWGWPVAPWDPLQHPPWVRMGQRSPSRLRGAGLNSGPGGAQILSRVGGAGLIIGVGGTRLIIEVGGAQVNCQDWRSSANYLSQSLLFRRQRGGRLGSPERLQLRFHLHQEGRENGAFSSAWKFSSNAPGMG